MFLLLTFAVLVNNLFASSRIEVGLPQLDEVMVFGMHEGEEVEIVKPTEEAAGPESVSSRRNVSHGVEIDPSDAKLMTVGGEVDRTENEEIEEGTKDTEFGTKLEIFQENVCIHANEREEVMVREREGGEKPIEESGGARREETLETFLGRGGEGGKNWRGRSTGWEMVAFGIEKVGVSGVEELKEEIKDRAGEGIDGDGGEN
jgi:hypothetical protein